MVIERALEKLKQDGIARPGRPRSAGAAHARRSSDVNSSSARVARPAFPQLRVDLAAAEAHRIVVPDLAGSADARTSASYRMLRTRLLHAMRTNHWTSLAITSPGPGEGKSVTALNLAINLARDKSSDVFLLDLDMRKPSMCRYLGVRPPHDLVGYFSGQGSPEDVCFTIGPENLTLAGCNTNTEHASELLASNRFEELLDYIASISADPIILVDLPPVLVTDEALLVAPRVDAAILVVGEGRTRRDTLLQARRLLAEFTLAGVILNASQSIGNDSYYGYGYGYNHDKPAP